MTAKKTTNNTNGNDKKATNGNNEKATQTTQATQNTQATQTVSNKKPEKWLIDGKVQDVADRTTLTNKVYSHCINEKDSTVECSSVETDKNGVKVNIHYFVKFDLSKKELLEYAVRNYMIREMRKDPVNGFNNISVHEIAKLKDQTLKVSDYQNKKERGPVDPQSQLKTAVEKLKAEGWTKAQIQQLLKG